MRRILVLMTVAALLLPIALFAGGAKEEPKAPAAGAAAPAAPVTVKISSGSLGGSWYPFGANVGENILKPGGMQYTNEPGGGASNIVAVSTGKTDMGITMTTSIALAEKGEGPYKGVKYTNLMVVARLFDDPLHILVPRNSNIHSVSDLRGKKIASSV